MTEPLLTARDLARALKVRERSIRHWTAKYGLPSFTIGRSRYYYLSQVTEWLKTRQAPVEQPGDSMEGKSEPLREVMADDGR